MHVFTMIFVSIKFKLIVKISLKHRRQCKNQSAISNYAMNRNIGP